MIANRLSNPKRFYAPAGYAALLALLAALVSATAASSGAGLPCAARVISQIFTAIEPSIDQSAPFPF